MTSQQKNQPATGPIPYRPHEQVGSPATGQRTVIRGNAVSHSPIDVPGGSWAKPSKSQLEAAQEELYVARRENRSNFVFFLVVLGVALILGAFLAQLMFPASAWNFSDTGAGEETALPGYVLHDLASLSSASYSGVA